MDYSEVTIVIPTLNEAGSIVQLIEKLQGLYSGINVMVADDNSSDGTQELVKGFNKPSVMLLERIDVQFRGITASVIDAILNVQTKFFLVMDGDMQHPPEVAGMMMDKLAEGADIAAGARIPYKENQGLHRIVVTRVATKMAKIWLRLRGVSVKDPMSGLFGGKTDLVRETIKGNLNRFEPQGYKIFFDLLRVIDPKSKIMQVDYQFAMREEGESKLRPAHMMYFLRSLFK